MQRMASAVRRCCKKEINGTHMEKIPCDAHANDAYFAVYLSLLQENLAPPLPIVGNSMAPYLKNGRDAVILRPVTEKERLHRGDIYLYRRDSGAYILHRMVAVRHDRCFFAGDAQTYVEKNVRREQLIAVVTAVVRHEKTVSAGFRWYFFRTVWIALLPWRRFIMKIHAYFRKRCPAIKR